MSPRTILALTASAALTASIAITAAGSAVATTADRTADRGAATYVALKGGATTLHLDPGTAQALTDNGISVAPASEARVKGGGIAFPIQGGLLNAKTLAGKVTHSGGLTFTAGGKDLTIRDFTINTKKKHLTVRNVKAKLTAAAAGALNSYYSTSLFQGGLKIGTATLSASIKVLRG